MQSGFFAWVDGAPAEGYRAPRNPPATPACAATSTPERRWACSSPRDATLPSASSPVSSARGSSSPLVRTLGRDDIRVIPVRNEFFGGNTSVTGLMVGEDIARVLAAEPAGHRYLLPDVCLSEGRFLDGTTVDALPRPVEVVPTDGIALRRALGAPILESVS